MKKQVYVKKKDVKTKQTSKKRNRCQDKTKDRCENKTDVKLTKYMSKQKIDIKKQNMSKPKQNKKTKQNNKN